MVDFRTYILSAYFVSETGEHPGSLLNVRIPKSLLSQLSLLQDPSSANSAADFLKSISSNSGALALVQITTC